jgi:hypothetical protein
MKISFATILICGFLLGVTFPLGAGALAQSNDVIAKVGDQTITFREIEIMINSSDMIGMGVPPPGSAARNEARLIVLDKVISADLLYLDAMKQGMQNNPVYQNDVERFSRAILAAVYREKRGIGDIKVTDSEVRNYYKKNIVKGTPLTPEVRMGIEATIRKERFIAKRAALQKELRKGVEIVVDKTKLNPDGDAARASSEVVARINQESITWGELRSGLTDSAKSRSVDGRVEALDGIIDEHITVNKAKAARLDQDPTYLSRVREFKKVHLVSLYKAKLVGEMEPSDREIKEYFEKNKEKIQAPESRKIQMVVLKTKEEANDVKKKIQSGEITIFEAAAKYSIDPNARLTLGEFGWVAKGTGFPELDRLTFSLKLNDLGGPVESPAGWHLVKVLEARDAQYQDIKDKDTWQRVRNMMLREKQDEYVVNLRKNVFAVEVYNDVLRRIVRQEEEKINANRKKSEKTSLPEQESNGKGDVKKSDVNQ